MNDDNENFLEKTTEIKQGRADVDVYRSYFNNNSNLHCLFNC